MTAFYNVGTRRRAHTGRTCCSNGSGSNRGCIHISGAHPHPLLAAVVISEAIILMQAASVPWAADADAVAVAVGVAFGVGVGVVSPKRRHLVECHMRKHTHTERHTHLHTQPFAVGLGLSI